VEYTGIMFLFAAFLWGLEVSDYSWMAAGAVTIPVLVYSIRRLRKRMVQLKARSLWLEEDFVP
jgi:hypothetical protein